MYFCGQTFYKDNKSSRSALIDIRNLNFCLVLKILNINSIFAKSAMEHYFDQ